MLTKEAAKGIVKVGIPNGKIVKGIDYGDSFIFLVLIDFPEEEGMDPFFSVNKDTGELRDFSIFDAYDTDLFTKLFVEARLEE